MNKNTENKTTMSATYARMSTRKRKLLNAAFIILFILVFAAVNVLSMALVEKFPGLEKDLTAKNAYSLNTVTDEYMKYLEKEINIKVLLEEEQILAIDSTYGYQVNRLLKEMSKYDKVNVEYLEIAATSVKAMTEKYPDIDWTSPDNFLIIENAKSGKYEALGVYDIFAQGYDANYELMINGQYLEQSVLTSAQKITADKIFKVAFSIGNGEFFNPNSEFYNQFTYLPYFLQDNAYEVENLNLLTETPSEELDVIIMMAPTVDLTADSAQALTDWLHNDGDKGKTLVYVPYDQAKEMPNLDLFLEQWGMKVTRGYISENDMSKAMSMGDNAPNLFPLMDYYDNTFTDTLQNKYLSVIMPFCMPVEITNEELAVPMLTSSDTADILVPTDSQEQPVETIKSEGKPLAGAAASAMLNDDGKRSNVVVWGSFDALKNDWTYSSYSGNVNNITYFINLLNPMTDNDSVIVVESADLAADYLLVTSAQKVTIGIIFILLIPVAVMATGIVIWNKRRHR